MPKQQQTPQTDARDLEQCYREEYPTLLRIAQLLLDNEQLAEVLVQETFLCALRYIHKFNASPNHMGWLIRTLRLTANHLRREQKLLQQRYVPMDELSVLSEEPISLDTLSMRAYSSNEDMQLLFRFYVAGYSARELATESGTTSAAINMRLLRARKRLRSDPYLKELYETTP